MPNNNPTGQGGFIPGQSGNPKGRPKREWTWAGELQKAAEQIHKETGKTFKEIIANNLIVRAAGNDNYASKIIMERMDGFPSQDITSGGEPLGSKLVVDTKPEPK